MPLLLKTTTQTGSLYRQIVSTSMPEKPKALSPSTASTGLPVSIAAAMAKPMPMPMTPQVPTSRRLRAVEVHRRRILHQPRRHLGDVFVLFRLDGADPVRRRGRPLAVHALEKSRHAGADIADQRRDDLDIAVHLLGLDVDLDELPRSRLAPALTLAVRQKPVEAGADQHDDVGVFQHRRARRTGALRMRVGQEALAHA